MLHEQEALYQAQAKVFPFHGQTFHSIYEIANYLTNLMETEWFFTTFGFCPDLQIKEWKDRNRWAGAADIKTFTLFFKVGPQAESVVLHEIAHLLCDDKGHGQCFATAQLKLVRQQMGFHCYAEYRNALRETGVFDA